MPVLNEPDLIAPDLITPLEFLANCADPYPVLCAMLVMLLESVKMPLDDKHDILSDVSDILDKIKPSARSGFIVKRKPRKGD